MKRIIIILFLTLAFAFNVFAQAADQSVSEELIVVLNTSVSMSNYHRETSEYLIGPFLREFLRIGDTFHLISFSGSPRVEISRRVEGIGDLETIIGRLLLMSPLDPDTNVAAALNFAETFATTLPGTRPRRIIFLSDGADPNTQNLVNASINRLSGQRTELQFIQVPVIGAGPSSGRPALIAQGRPPVQAPPGHAVPPGQIVPPGQQQPPGQAVPPGQQQPPGQAVTPGQQQPPGQQQRASIFEEGIPLPLLIGLGILALAILALLIFLASRSLHKSPNRVMAKAAAPQNTGSDIMSKYAENKAKQARPPLEHPTRQSKPLPKDRIYADSAFAGSDGGPLMLNLFVEDQNTAIGKRNIHSAKPGTTFSIGGGKSDFLIFLVPIPPHIADVTYDGRNCTLYPRKSKYLPDIGSQSVSNCIGKTIRVISDKNYELYFRIEMYEDPLKRLNKLLNSISVPGIVT